MTEPTPATTVADDSTEFLRFLRNETWGGVILAVMALLALAWVNSPWAGGYEALRDVEFGPEALHLHLSLGEWVRDGLLAVFFLVVGLELKRELVIGELSNLRAATFPIVAAVGGIIVPAGIAAAIMWGEPGAGRAWAIPTATDIAFALGVLAIAGSALPNAVRLILLALAVVDDLVAIILIAVLFSDGVDLLLLLAFVALAALWWFAQQRRISTPLLYVPLALLAWGTLHASGVHATIAGVVLGLLTRVRCDPGETEAPALRLEHRLQPWSAGLVVPLFALFAAGVPLDLDAVRSIATDPIAIGVFVGLVLGKLIGILGAAWLGGRLGIARRPDDVTWGMLAAIGALGGVGFTVSLLVAELALAGEAAERAKAAVLLASAAAVLLAVVLLRGLARREARTAPAAQA